MSGGEDLFEARLPLRIERLRQELRDENVPLLTETALPDGLPAGQVEAFQSLVLEEVVYARYVPVHEGLRPSYGCLIVRDTAAVTGSLDSFRAAEAPITQVIADEAVDPGAGGRDGGQAATSEAAVGPSPHTAAGTIDLHAIRPLVDGQLTILIRDLNGAGGLATLDVSEELGAVDATRAHGGISVQRLPSGRIRIVTRRHIAVSDGHDWSVRPHAGSVVNSLTSELMLPGDRVARMREIGSLLEFCYHSLSPAGIGATLVVSLQGPAQNLESGVSDSGTQPAVNLNVFDRSNQTLLRNVLAAVDGACLVDPDGSLRRYQTKLTSNKETASLIAEHGGTRHTSAKRFSFEHPDALVVVVSADGPVTLFCSGVIVASLTERDPDSAWMHTASSHVRKRAKDSIQEGTCTTCRSELATRLTVDPEDDSVTPLHCIVCGGQVAEVTGVLESTTRIKRRWE